MKITIIAIAPGWGGTELHTVALARALHARGHEVRILELGSDLYRDRFESGVKVSRLAPGPSGSLGPLKLLRALRKHRGDLCIFPKSWYPAGSLVQDLAVRMTFPRYLTIEHLASQPVPPRSSGRHLFGLLPGAGLWWYRAKLDDLCRSRLPHRVVCVSGAVARGLVDHHGFAADKVTTIHNGVDPARFSPDPLCRRARRAELGIAADALVFGAVGRFDAMKGFDTAIRLFKKLLDGCDGRDLRLLLVGQGDGRQELAALVAALCLGEKVRLEPFTDAPWEMYPAFDVFLMPSRNEGLPLSLLEAMACGVPPIAMGVGGVPEIISTPGVGWLVEPDDRAGFLTAMEEAALSGPARLAAIGENARLRVVSRFQGDRQFLALARLVETDAGGGLVPPEDPP